MVSIKVKVHANSRQERLVRISDEEYEVWLSKPAIEGKANIQLISILAGYFNVPKSGISIVKGHKSNRKIVSIIS